jgi:hypothetical protein
VTDPDPLAKYDVVAYTDDGKAYPPEDDQPRRFSEIYSASGGYRGAVAQQRGDRQFYVFDTYHAEMAPPPVHLKPRRWWTFVDRARALAHALWFLR